MSYTIYSKDNCHFCKRAKQLLDEKNMQYKEINLDPINKREEYDNVVPGLKEKTSQSTFPFIFMDDKFIGGYSELVLKLLTDDK